MNRSKPPAMASWLLEHLTRRTGNDALAGDLAEEFLHGRSAGWYWRQVLWALLVRLLKKARSTSYGLGFALLWSLWVTPFSRSIPTAYFGLSLQGSWLLQFSWPWSTLFSITCESAPTVLSVVSGLSAYSLLLRKFSGSGFVSGIVTSFILQTGCLATIDWVKSRDLAAAISLAVPVISMWVAMMATSEPALPRQ